MKKIEYVYREILYGVLEKKKNRFTQSELAKKFNISLSTVNHSLQPLRKMNAIDVRNRGFVVIDFKKILYYWASIRNVKRDIVYSTRIEMPVSAIESSMPPKIVFAAYSAYKFKFNDAPSDYSEVYVYADLEDVKKRFPVSSKIPNLFVLKKDSFISDYGNIPPLAQIFVDLWNIPSWYAKDFLKELEVKINGILE